MLEQYLLEINIIEELQNTRNVRALDQLFARAKSTLVQGGTVVLCRKQKNGTQVRFDAIDNETDLATFKIRVYQYL